MGVGEAAILFWRMVENGMVQVASDQIQQRPCSVTHYPCSIQQLMAVHKALPDLVGRSADDYLFSKGSTV